MDTSLTHRGYTRRRFLNTTLAATAGLGAAALVGCSSSGGKSSAGAPAASNAGAPKGPTAASIIGKAWGVRDPNAVPVYGGTFNYASGTPTLPSLDPFLSTANFAHANASMVYSHLLHNSHPPEDRNELIFYPDIATSWEIGDASKFVFKLRNDVKFQNVAPTNGRPLTAEDVKYATLRAVNDKQSPFRGTLSAIKSIDTPDATTVVINLNNFDAGLFPALADRFAWIMPKELVEAGLHKQSMAGSGPFIFQKWEQDAQITYKRNPDYYLKGIPFFDTINFQQIANAQSRLAVYRSGQTQLAGIDREDLDSILADKKTWVSEDYIAVGTSSIMMNYKEAVWKDIRVRKAISLIGNPDEVAKIQTDPKGLWRGVLSAQNKGWVLNQDELKSKKYFLRQDLQEAKQLMDAAGFGSGFKTKLLYRTGSRPEEELPQYISATAKKGGVADIQLVPQDNATMRKNQDAVNYEGLCSGIDGEPLPEAFLVDFHTGGPKNGMGLSDKNVDAMIDKAISTVDTNQRKEAVLNVARFLLENVMYKRNFTDSTSTGTWRSELKNYFGAVPQQYNENGFAFAWIDNKK